MDASSKNLAVFKKHIANKKPAFLFLYMDGCGPCERAKKGWAHISDHLSDQERKRHHSVMIAQINQNLFSRLQSIGSQPRGFPTFRFIRGSHIEEYNGGREGKDLANWIRTSLHIKREKHKWMGGNEGDETGGVKTGGEETGGEETREVKTGENLPEKMGGMKMGGMKMGGKRRTIKKRGSKRRRTRRQRKNNKF